MERWVSPKRALVSVWRKDGLIELARALHAHGVELLSTGGTARALREAGFAVRDVAEVTGFPEMLDGRVKTLHPRIHGGLLHRRDDPAHQAAIAAHHIPAIDLLVVDLYPFADAARDPSKSQDEIIEMIDVGGPAMLRAAAKNSDDVIVLSDPDQYAEFLAAFRAESGRIGHALRRRFAAAAFAKTAAYDALVAAWMEKDSFFPDRMQLPLERVMQTRYGENPHQKAALYRHPDAPRGTVARAVLESGKDLSYNNLLDASQALEVVRRLPVPAAAVVKHGNPCGASIGAVGEEVLIFERALAGDPISAYGGILALNGPLDLQLAQRIADPALFFEVIIAPVITEAAVNCIQTAVKWGKSVRLLEVGPLDEALRGPGQGRFVLRSISGGVLVQESDEPGDPAWKVVTQRAPSEAERNELGFAWEVCRHVASNAIVLTREGRVIGVGAGQMSRVDSVVIAVRKGGGLVRGAVLASDAFFPFADGLEIAAEAGVRAVIQPGGSRRDDEVIEAADRKGIAMVFTGRRHFRH